MERIFPGKARFPKFYALPHCLILVTCIVMFGIVPALSASAAYARVRSISGHTLSTCPIPATPTDQSQLVVLLDRSGSLIQQPGATDPEGYSTSVTKALADLWPGIMTVIPFGNNATPLLGPADLSNPAQKAVLKGEVEQYPIGGNTPLGPAMHAALKQLQGAAPGSRVILITDGNPTGQGNSDGAHQEQDIRDNLIGQFCKQGIPISAFGLTIDPNTLDGQDANHLLTDITKGTAAMYTNIRSPQELASTVISLYAEWEHLNFTQETSQNNNFPVSLDSFAKQVDIITFRSDSSDTVTLDGPDDQPVQGVQASIDKHYVIDTLVPGLFVAGTYIVHTSDDPNVQVYALVNSPLQIHINAPTSQTAAYGKPIIIRATLLDSNNLLTPIQGQAQLVAHVRLLVDGRQVGQTNDIILEQQGAFFEGQTLTYNQTGELRIEVEGSYQGVQRTASTSVQLVAPPPLPPAPCKLGALPCFWRQHQTQILILIPLALFSILLLILWLFWRCQPRPCGYLRSKRDEAIQISLRGLPRFPANLVRRSIVRSGEIRHHPHARKGFPFGTASFDLVFKHGCKAYIRPAKNGTVQLGLRMPVKGDLATTQIRPSRGRLGGVLNMEEIELKPGELTELPFGSIIVVRGDPIASFEALPGAGTRRH